MKTKSLIVTLLVFLILSSSLVAQDDTPAYLDASLTPDERVADLLPRMSLEEKIGQMTLVEKNSINPVEITTYYIGGLLSGGGGYPFGNNTPEGWLAMVQDFQARALETPLKIPMIYGVDAVHGHNNLYGAVIFPHNIGLGATRNPQLVEQIAHITAKEMIGTGIYWNYAPVLAVPQDIRWGRIYEGFSENTELVTQLGTAYLKGLQGENLADPLSVLGTPKHFIGDGAAEWGTSTIYVIDQGMMNTDEETIREKYLPPYIDAINNNAKSIMISFSGWNGTKMHAEKYLVTDVLKDELSFSGFVVSDWAGMDQVDPDYYTAMVTSVNAGVDMNMVPYDYYRFITVMLEAVEKGDISMERIDDAVTRILRVKFELGLFERPTGDATLTAEIGSDEHRAVARQAVSESLVLLQNKAQTLPLAKDTPVIFVGGVGADDIGLQAGGWTIEWQGVTGSDVIPGTTILDAIKEAVSPETQVYYNKFAKFTDLVDEAGNPLKAPVGIVVVAEQPYAEGRGDSNNLRLSRGDMTTINQMRQVVDQLVLIVISGRPVLIADQLDITDAAVAAWLPGTEGNGVTDVLFGDQEFVGKLPFTWLRTIDQLPFDLANLPTDGCAAPLFPYGYGLTTATPEDQQISLYLCE